MATSFLEAFLRTIDHIDIPRQFGIYRRMSDGRRRLLALVNSTDDFAEVLQRPEIAGDLEAYAVYFGVIRGNRVPLDPYQG